MLNQSFQRLRGPEPRPSAADVANFVARDRTGHWPAVALVVSIALGLLLVVAPSAFADACPNAGLRLGSSRDLPDCRAYELVSPPGAANVETFRIYTSEDGSHVAYSAGSALSGAQQATRDPYMAVRTGGDWETTPLVPELTEPAGPLFYNENQGAFGYSSDFTTSVLNTEDGIAAADTNGSYDLYTRQPTGSYVWDSNGPATGGRLAGVSADGSHVVIDGSDGNVYEAVDGGPVTQVNVAPSGSTLAQAVVGSFDVNDGTAANAVSSDGSTIFFESGVSGARGTLWAREDGTTTVQIATNAIFDGASADGSKVFYTTNPAGSPSDNELYEYNLADGVTTHISAGAAADAMVEGDPPQVAVSQDGSIVYFIAQSQLVAGQGTPGANNMYVYDDGTLRFIAAVPSDPGLGTPLATEDVASGIAASSQLHFNLTPDGGCLAFLSSGHLVPAVSGTGSGEALYVYDLSSGTLVLASTSADGAGASYDVSFPQADPFVVHTPRFLSNDCQRVFFDTNVALAPQATNGRINVYEHDLQTGETALISTGTASTDSLFFDSSASGSDAFFTTTQALVPVDTNSDVDVYDARVDGGLASQNPGQAPPPCQNAGDCQGAASAPPVGFASATVAFVGPGDVTAATSTHAEVKLLSPRVHGGTVDLRIVVPTRGTVTVSGRGVRAFRRSFSRSGMRRLKVRLSRRGCARIRGTREVGRPRILLLHLRFVGPDGAARVTVRLMVHPRGSRCDRRHRHRRHGLRAGRRLR